MVCHYTRLRNIGFHPPKNNNRSTLYQYQAAPNRKKYIVNNNLLQPWRKHIETPEKSNNL